jgi:thiamine-phosphate pyrophosphorylase
LCTSRTSRKAVSRDKSPLLYYITDRKRLNGISLLECIRRALDLGVDFIQLREKDLSDRELFELTCRILSLSHGTKCRILVNGRADIALAAGAHGVHLPSDGLEVSDVRPWLPEGFQIGVSVHTLREIRKANTQNADYILVGHVFDTPSKEGYGPALGLEFLQKACSLASMPALALGGMRLEQIKRIVECGAAGIAGITLFQQNT